MVICRARTHSPIQCRGSAAHGGDHPDGRTGTRDLGAVPHRLKILEKTQTMKFTPPDTCLEDYEKRRAAFLKDLIAITPNVSARAKEFRRWIDENSPYRDEETRNRRSSEAPASSIAFLNKEAPPCGLGRHSGARARRSEGAPSAEKCSGDFLPPSPPAEKATARQDQARKSSTGDGGFTSDFF